jgi:hypothetical protein
MTELRPSTKPLRGVPTCNPCDFEVCAHRMGFPDTGNMTRAEQQQVFESLRKAGLVDENTES